MNEIRKSRVNHRRLAARSRLRARAARSGFALIFVMTAVLLLSIFLLAAQGSVAVSHSQMRRSANKLDDSGRTAAALDAARRSLSDGAGDEQKAFRPVALAETPEGVAVECVVRRLDSSDPAYAPLPGIAHRPGDGLASVTITRKGLIEASQYLINGAGRRSGAIRIPAAPTGADAKPLAAQTKTPEAAPKP